MDSHEITKAIKEARPRLASVSPLVAKIVLGYATINVLLGASLVATTAKLSTGLVIAPTQLAFQVWGALFAILGVAMFITYWRNSWKGMRALFVVGMCFKFAWAIALVIRLFSGEFSNPIILIIWLFFTYIQAVAYIHFMPIPTIEKGAKDADI